MLAYVEIDSAAPAGSSNPTTYSGKDLDNVRALRDLAITGRVPGWIQSRAQGTGPGVDRPQFITWLNATLSIGFRMNITWGGTGNYQQSSVQWQWAAAGDYPNTWTNMGAAQANTWDANNNITATTNSGGAFSLVLEVWTKALKVIADLAAHVAAAGTAVHGLGNMSTQAKTAVDIDGGAIDATAIGDSTRARGSFTRVAEDVNIYTPGAGAGVNIDWAKGASHLTTNGVNVLAFVNVPAGGAGHMLYTTNLNNTTFPASVSWGAFGKPAIAGACYVNLVTLDTGVTVAALVAWRAV